MPFPTVSPTQVKIILKAPGLTRERSKPPCRAVDRNCRHPAPAPAAFDLENALTDITLDFEDCTDIYWARQQVASAWPRRWTTCARASGGWAG